MSNCGGNSDMLQTYECRAELAELDGIDALGEAVEGDGAAFDGGLDDTYTLEVVDADGGALGYLHIQVQQIEILSQFLGKLCLGICAAIVNERPGMVDIDGDRQVVIVVALLVGIGGQLLACTVERLLGLGDLTGDNRRAAKIVF